MIDKKEERVRNIKHVIGRTFSQYHPWPEFNIMINGLNSYLYPTKVGNQEKMLSG